MSVKLVYVWIVVPVVQSKFAALNPDVCLFKTTELYPVVSAGKSIVKSISPELEPAVPVNAVISEALNSLEIQYKDFEALQAKEVQANQFAFAEVGPPMPPLTPEELLVQSEH